MSAEIISEDNFRQDIVRAMLLPGENIVHITAISPGIYWKSVAVMICALVALVFYGLWLGLYILAVACIMLLLAYWNQKYLVLAATDHRIIIRAGFLNQEVLQLRYPQIESVDTFYTLPGLLLGYGSVIITGTGMSRWVIPYVQDAVAFRNDLTQRLLEREEPLRQITQTIPQPASQQPSAHY